ncbi:hypothetical protein [Luteimonas suaedae]|uniref:hypothetical protein n=1 Tax=Luteimonas suaedae TaxID=2605430 RepID=UPI0011EEAA85|nr:hypothetical protein [Luteimonas suaedae]
MNRPTRDRRASGSSGRIPCIAFGVFWALVAVLLHYFGASMEWQLVFSVVAVLYIAVGLLAPPRIRRLVLFMDLFTQDFADR